jgi:hypothetical protein
VLVQDGEKEAETQVFTMTLGSETIELLPFKNWGQLDAYKWGMRGRLPGTPAGLDITPDHVKLLGETVPTNDPEGCAKLEKVFNEWLVLERENLELARKKAHPKQAPAPAAASGPGEPEAMHFRVERDKGGQVHIQCLQGKEPVAAIGLNLPGFTGLFSSGIMRKPHSMQVGVLHDWVELDGVLFSFERDHNDTGKLEKALNEKYLPETAVGRGKDIVFFTNAASSTGFDIQFPVRTAGVTDNRKRALNEDSLALLQDPNACGVLHKGVVIKLTRPCLVFKQKTLDGGERYFDRSPENTVTIKSDEGREKVIDLSQPVNYLRLGPVELTAVFNHPSINQHSQAAPPAGTPAEARAQPTLPGPAAESSGAGQVTPAPSPAQPSLETPAPKATQVREESQASPGESGLVAPAPAATPPAEVQKPIAQPADLAAGAAAPAAKPEEKPTGEAVPKPEEELKPRPNAWLGELLARPSIRHDWFVSLVYSQVAERFSNSHEGRFGLSACWYVAMGEIENIEDPGFIGIFLTEKRGLGFLNQGRLARFSNGVAVFGTQESAIAGIGVSLVGVGLDARQRVIFAVTDNYRGKFGVPEQALSQELARLNESGALILSVKELLQSPDPIQVLWTVPAEQENPSEPQALESTLTEG